MSANFDFAIPLILKAEGFRPGHTGLVDDPDDPGGITNYGISLRALRKLGPIVGDFDGDGDVDADDIMNMTYDDAVSVYQNWYWQPELDVLHREVAYRFADHWVNAGWTSASKVVQRALRAMQIQVSQDGKFGPQTRDALLAAGTSIIPVIRAERAGFYRSLVAGNENFEKYERGWLNRAYS